MKNTTNNVMELTACIEALKFLESEKLHTDDVSLFTDSAYIANCFKERWYVKWEQSGWRKSSNKKPVKNKMLWKTLLSLYRGFVNIEIQHVKGHAGNKFNEMADSLAVAASERCKSNYFREK